jgi:hypothetical protein
VHRHIYEGFTTYVKLFRFGGKKVRFVEKIYFGLFEYVVVLLALVFVPGSNLGYTA